MWWRVVISTNIMALRALGESRKTDQKTKKTLEKLSSGFRINRAADDAAGLGVSESMRAQITELTRCRQNVREGMDIADTADGALAEINEMLRRAKRLCVQAANGIYDDSDKEAVSMEMNELFGEIDRITEGTRHNEIALFRYKGSSLKLDKNTKYEYVETFTPLDPTAPLVTWGQMDFVKDAKFDPPKNAEAATATLKFDSSVNLADAMTLKGKSVTIGGRTFTFTDGYAGTYQVSVSAGQSVQTAMNNLVNRYNAYYPTVRLQSASVDAKGTVKFQAALTGKSETIVVDGKNVTSSVANGSGAYANNLSISSQDGVSIKQVDGSDATNNQAVRGTTATAALALPARTLTADDVANLNGNTLYVCGKTISLKNKFTAGMTQDQVGAVLAGEIGALSGLTADYKDGKLTVNISGLSPAAASPDLRIYETVTAGTSTPVNGVSKAGSALSLAPAKTGAATTDGAPKTVAGLGITVTTTPPSLELSASATITLPPSLSGPFAFQAGGTKYVFYDSTDPAFQKDAFPELKFDSTVTRVDTKGMTEDAIQSRVMAYLKGAVPSGTVVTQDGNKLKIESTSVNKPMSLPVIQGVSVTATPYKKNAESWELTLPSTFSRSTPFSYQTNSYTKYYYYDSSQVNFDKTQYPSMKFNTTNVTAVDIKGWTDDQIRAHIGGRIAASHNANVSVSGNKVTVTAKTPGASLTLNTDVKGISVTATSYKTNTTPGTSYVLGGMNLGTNFSPQYLVREFGFYPLHLGGKLDIAKLAGSGFSLGANHYEFVAGGAGLRDDYTDVDISAAASFEDVRKALADAMGAAYKITLDDSNPADVQIRIGMTSAAYPAFTDGYHDLDGIFTNSGDKPLEVKFSGGTDVGHSQKAIDFSTIDDSNLDSLLGKGFRITCATCTGEYINVFFCWENNNRVPESFTLEDPVSGLTRTIHNVTVELSKVSSGDKIVEEIVKQVKPTLKHYTDVAVGSSPSELLAMEKRLGNVTDGTTIFRAEIISGLKTNFEYTVEKREVEEDPPVITSGGENGGLSVAVRNLYIYAGSFPDHQWIPIHLPYLDLGCMNLLPEVDLRQQSADGWMERVDEANKLISACRGRIGADHNRLEHTLGALTITNENITESESRLRDADMAQLMIQQVRDSILTQGQMGLLAQANAQPQQVLQLLR